MKLGWQHFIDNFAFWRPVHQCLTLYFVKGDVPTAPEPGLSTEWSWWEVFYTSVKRKSCHLLQHSQNFRLLPHNLWYLHPEWCFNLLNCRPACWLMCHTTNMAEGELWDQILALHFHSSTIILLILCLKVNMLGLKLAKACICLGRAHTFAWSLSTRLCLFEIEIWNFRREKMKKSSRKLATEATWKWLWAWSSKAAFPLLQLWLVFGSLVLANWATPSNALMQLLECSYTALPVV